MLDTPPPQHKSFAEWLRNGGRAQALTGLLAVVALLVFIASLITNISGDGEYRPLTNYATPFPVVWDAESAKLTIVASLCASDEGADDDTQTATFISTASLEKLDDEDEGAVIAAGTVPVRRPIGCDPDRRDYILRLPPGRYRIQGTDIATDGNRNQPIYWESQPFTVGEPVDVGVP